MRNKTRKITIGAMLSALTIALMYIASIVPSLQLAISAISGLFIIAGVIEGGYSLGISVYVVSGVVSLLISSDKVGAIFYVIFFGYYPIIKSLIEKIGKKSLVWILKFLSVNIVLTVIFFVFSKIIVIDFNTELLNSKIVLYIIGNICFFIYDLALTKLAILYTTRIYKKR